MNELSSGELVKYIQETYPHLVQDMIDCSHHLSLDKPNKWHFEGDCWTHTLLVLQQADFRFPDDYINRIACMLHDFGKPMSMYRTDFKVGFHGHSGLSNYVIPNILNDPHLGLSEDDKILISQIINLHIDFFQGGFFKEITEDGNVQLTDKGYKLFSNNYQVFTQLIRLATCDENGRFSSNHQSDAFYRSLAWIAHDLGNETAKDEKEEDGDKPRITILVGPPCTGKSTWLASQPISDDSVIVSRDNVMMELADDGLTYNEAFKAQDSKKVDFVLREVYSKAVKDNENIVVDMTNMSRKTRRKWLSSISDKYITEAVIFIVDLAILNERNTLRAKSEGKYIPDAAFEQMCKNFSAPFLGEFDKVKWIV